jgi:hypothetical protein
MKIVDNETAVIEVDRFFEALKISDLKRDQLKKMPEELALMIEYGVVVIDTENRVNYKLINPILNSEGGVELESLIFANRRLTVGEFEKTNKASNDTERSRMMIGMFTKKPSNIFSKMDTEDFINLNTICTFFL